MKYNVQVEARHATSPHIYAVVRIVEGATLDEARALIREAVARYGVVPTTTDEKGRKVWLLTDAEVARIKPINPDQPQDLDHGDDLV
jgi:hypothetical protein